MGSEMIEDTATTATPAARSVVRGLIRSIAHRLADEQVGLPDAPRCRPSRDRRRREHGFIPRTHAAPLLMVGDVTYELELLEAGRVPGVGDAAGLHKVSSMVRDLKARYPDLAVLPAHDPGAAERLRVANTSGSEATR